MTELKFVFEVDNTRIEELNEEGDTINTLVTDWGTVEGLFKVWEKAGVKKVKTISELEKIAMQG